MSFDFPTLGSETLAGTNNALTNPLVDDVFHSGTLNLNLSNINSESQELPPANTPTNQPVNLSDIFSLVNERNPCAFRPLESPLLADKCPVEISVHAVMEMLDASQNSAWSHMGAGISLTQVWPDNLGGPTTSAFKLEEDDCKHVYEINQIRIAITKNVKFQVPSDQLHLEHLFEVHLRLSDLASEKPNLPEKFWEHFILKLHYQQLATNQIIQLAPVRIDRNPAFESMPRGVFLGTMKFLGTRLINFTNSCELLYREKEGQTLCDGITVQLIDEGTLLPLPGEIYEEQLPANGLQMMAPSEHTEPNKQTFFESEELETQPIVSKSDSIDHEIIVHSEEHFPSNIVKFPDPSELTSQETMGGRPLYREKSTGREERLLTVNQVKKLAELKERWETVSANDRLGHCKMEDIYPFLIIGRDEAANRMGVSITWLKKAYRHYGGEQWPSRALLASSKKMFRLKEKIHSMQREIASLDKVFGSSSTYPMRVSNRSVTESVAAQIERMNRDIDELRAERLEIIIDRSRPRDSQLVSNKMTEFCQNLTEFLHQDPSYLDADWCAIPPFLPPLFQDRARTKVEDRIALSEHDSQGGENTENTSIRKSGKQGAKVGRPRKKLKASEELNEVSSTANPYNDDEDRNSTAVPKSSMEEKQQTS